MHLQRIYFLLLFLLLLLLLFYRKNETYCTTLPILLFGNETESENGTNITIHYNACEFNHSGKGLLYQIVAGPVFNNLYPLAGIFTGFLADYGYRTIWLVISLVFWSAITGVTGFSQAYWHLVLLRALLAIGYFISIFTT